MSMVERRSVASRPLGALDAVGSMIGAERWFVSRLAGGHWVHRSSRASLADDVLLALSPELAEMTAPRIVEPRSLGALGARLSDIGSLLVVASSKGDAVVCFEDPDAERTLVSVGSFDASFVPAMVDAVNAETRSADLHALATWLPLVAEHEEGSDRFLIRALADALGADSVALLMGNKASANFACTWGGHEWEEVAIRDGIDAQGVIDLLAPGVTEWSTHEGVTLVIERAYPVSRDALDLAVNVLSATLQKGWDDAATRNNALLRERARIASVIHEGITQVLTNVAVQMEVLDKILEQPEAARPLLVRNREAVLEALDSLRGAILELTPNSPEWTDLAGGLERFVSDFGAQWGLDVSFSLEGEARDVDPELVALVFGFVQEGLSNVRKHAGTAATAVTLSFDESSILVSVSDDGSGFDPGTRTEGFREHQGLAITRSRARLMGAAVEIDTAPGSGTRLTLKTRG
jgi:signal transduction histidine kinase